MDFTIVTLTLTTLVSILALLVGGMIGWMARQHSYDTTPKQCMLIPKCLMNMVTYPQTKS